MMWAANWGRTEMAKLLLERGADRGIKDEDGKTALDKARQKGHADVVALLEVRRRWPIVYRAIVIVIEP